MGGEVNEAGGREAVPGSPPAGAGCSPPLQPPDDAVTSGGRGADGKRCQPPQTAAGGQGRCKQGAATKNKGHRAPEPQSHLAPPSPPTSQAAATHQTPAASPAPGSMPHPRILPPRPPPPLHSHNPLRSRVAACATITHWRADPGWLLSIGGI